MSSVDSSLQMTANEFETNRSKQKFLILFVFLGDKIPRYFIENVRYTSDLFSDLDVVLATTSTRQFRINGAKQLDLPEFLLRAGGGVGFRGGFWTKTFDRLFAIEAVHELFPNHRLLHIEGDVKLAPYLNFERFSASKLNWGRVTPTQDGAALLQSPTIDTSRRLGALLRMEVEKKPRVTDMSALANIRHSVPDLVELLPTEPASEVSEIFDFAPIGMWLGGTDPRNERGVAYFRRRQESHLVNPEQIQFSHRNGHLLVSSAVSASSEVQNLHLHSKNPSLFSSSWESVVSALLKNKQSIKFSLTASFAWCADRVGEYFRALKSVAARRIGN